MSGGKGVKVEWAWRLLRRPSVRLKSISRSSAFVVKPNVCFAEEMEMVGCILGSATGWTKVAVRRPSDAGLADIFLVSAARIIQMIRGQIPPKHPIHEEN
jgi:hypothetical protein